jgi:hypothetical protein
VNLKFLNGGSWFGFLIELPENDPLF